MKILMVAAKVCVQMTSNDTYFSDIWFSGVKTDDDAMAEGIYYWGLVKTSSKGFCLDKLENLMNYWPGGSYIVMRRTPRFPGGRPLIDIRYNYNYGKILWFISNEGAGSNEPGDPYLSRFPDMYFNVSIFPVVRPKFLGRHLNTCNPI